LSALRDPITEGVVLEATRGRPMSRTRRGARVLVPALAVLMAATGCGIARPIPPVYEPPAGTETSTVLLFGDSLLDQSDDEIISQSAAFGLPFEFVDEAIGGRGLLSMWNFTDPPRESLQGYLAEYEPDYVVFEFAGNYQQVLAAPGYENIVHGSDEFYAAWLEMYEWMMADIVAAGAVPITVIPPPMGPGSHEEEVRNALVDLYAEAAPANGSEVVDWSEALSARDCIVWIQTRNGLQSIPICYADELRYEGDIVNYTVRTTDRLHLAEHGIVRAARWTVAGLSAQLT